jgi:hypothetical protein
VIAAAAGARPAPYHHHYIEDRRPCIVQSILPFEIDVLANLRLTLIVGVTPPGRNACPLHDRFE